MNAWYAHVSDWPAMSAGPESDAACLASSVPSSGMSTIRAKAVMVETPGIDVTMTKRYARGCGQNRSHTQLVKSSPCLLIGWTVLC